MSEPMANKLQEPRVWDLPTLRRESTGTKAPRHVSHRIYEWGHRAACLLAALSVPFFFYVAVFGDPSARVIAPQQERQEVERENAAFCEKYGLSAGTPQHADCIADLMTIRARQNEHDAVAARRCFKCGSQFWTCGDEIASPEGIYLQLTLYFRNIRAYAG